MAINVQKKKPEILKTSDLVGDIRETLGCSQRVIANLLGLTPQTISNNVESSLEELTPRTRDRFLALHAIVVSIFGRGGRDLRREAILEIVQAQVFRDLHGRMDSVISALHQDKYPIETLIQIAEISYRLYQEKNQEKRKAFPELNPRVLQA